MVRDRNQTLSHVQRALDLLLTALAFGAAYGLKKHVLPFPVGGLIETPSYHVLFLLIIMVWYVSFYLFGVHEPPEKSSFGRAAWATIKAVCAAMVVLIILMYVIKITDVSRILMGLFFLADIALLLFGKWTLYRILARSRRREYGTRNFLIIGRRARAMDVIRAIQHQSKSGYRVLGCLDSRSGSEGESVTRETRVLGSVDQLQAVLKEHVVDEIIFAMPLKDLDDPIGVMTTAESHGIPTRILPDWQIHQFTYRPSIARMAFEDFLGVPSMTLKTTPSRQAELLFKSVFDCLFSGALLILLSPILLILAGVVKSSSRGPVLFTQSRCGLNGRIFTMYKFRTMRADAEGGKTGLETLNEADGPVFKMKRDPRVVPVVGPFLRRTGLDELPQLINVLKGEMSLIGPRPPLPSEVKAYETWQRRRLSMKPGITCLWQIQSRRNDVNFSDWMRMDLQYIDNWSLLLDAKIFLKTPLVMLTGGGR